MILSVYFTSGGTPSTGLSPTISIWDVAGTVYATASAMTEIAGGFYKYDFTTYDYSVDYVFQAYESSLDTADQYVSGSNDNDSQSSQGITKEILGLSQGNFVMSGQTYDVNGRLLTSDMYTYDTAADAHTDNNRLHTYAIVSTYDVNGNLTKYKVTEE
jgi:hypothetical protein